MRNIWLIVAVAACGGPGDPHGGLADAPPSEVAAPRLIAPLSMSSVTLQRPTLHWQLGPGEGTPTVDLCRDRACSVVLAVGAELAGDHSSAVPTTELPPGWVFWRVRVVSGSQTMTSATWQFWVGKISARTSTDTSNGAQLDVNGDGYPDFVVGADGAGAQTGVAHLYLGSADPSAAGWSATGRRIDLISPDGANASFGYAVASAGDINGDGYGDFLVGAYGAGANAGAVHLYLGSAAPGAAGWNGDGAPDRIDLAGRDGDGATFGAVMASAGDVDRDGYGDFLIGAAKAGAVHLYFGMASPGAADWSAAAAARRIDLTSPDGVAAFGGSLAGAGDVNGDGYADFLIGAAGANAATGAAHLYLGAAAPKAASWNGDPHAGRIDLTNPDGATASFGYAVASADDVNGDGYADFAITALGAAGNTGAAHVYLGLPTPVKELWNGLVAASRIDLISPAGAGALFGASATGAGDVNGDGYADLLVGAAGVTAGAGTAHLYLGAAVPSAAGWNPSDAAARIDLAALDGPGAIFGSAAASAGDVNGDGFADFVVGAHDASAGADAGAAHLYLGSAAPGAAIWNAASSTARIDLTNPDAASARFGISV
ncbi:MAG TPA: hypothetical protein VK607_17750, partial [Kofleriaceae bacterium]|nr:hypothetical protein [Kofleriaceae bacterium]